MITPEELHDAREDLAGMLTEVLTSVFAEEATVDVAPLPDGRHATARLAVLDELDGSHLGVEVRTGAALARVLAWRMFTAGEPTREDLLDAVGELGNIAAGNVKSLLFSSARLSLPLPAVTDDEQPSSAEGGPGDGAAPPGAVTITATVLGQVVELVLDPDPDLDGLHWPPTGATSTLPTPFPPAPHGPYDEFLESQP